MYFLGANCISWASKKQSTVARSIAEAEYRAMASTTAELVWLTYLLRDIGLPLPHPPQLFSDNMSALHMSINPFFHARTKHIELDYHFVREKVAIGTLITRFVPSLDQVADILTKPLSRNRFQTLRFKLGVREAPLSSLRGSDKCDKDIAKSTAKTQPTSSPKHSEYSENKSPKAAPDSKPMIMARQSVDA